MTDDVPVTILRAGTRGSRLAVLQTRNTLRALEQRLPGCRFEEVVVSSPGDRDLATDLRESPADFFTRDLDEKILSGELDCAVHSAKDVPAPLPDGLDWCWMPWREDPRDVLIRPADGSMDDVPAAPVIGVSSDRREAYSRERFPNAQLKPIRGNIEERLAQLDAGAYDLVIMAGCALKRLGIGDRITEWISLEALRPPEAQGSLAITFRAGNERLLRLRSMLVKAVTFAAAGVGSAGTCTLESLQALTRADICLHDALLGPDLVGLLPPSVRCIYVGKRAGRHSLPQDEITEHITMYARQGFRLVRLKGGDPGVFGRLAEEVEALDKLHIPYRVLPGVSSLSAGATKTGMLLTRRGVSRGFCVMTPRTKGGGMASVSAEQRARLPIVFYMAISVAVKEAKELIGEGMSPETPAAAVFGAGSDQAMTVSGELRTIADKIADAACTMPGILLVGDVVRYGYGTEWGALRGQRILLTASRSLQDRAAGLVTDFGGIPVCRPLITLVTTDEALDRVRAIQSYDWVVLTSPSAVRAFGELVRKADVDARAVPKLITCGSGTTRELHDLGFHADIVPESCFSAEGLIEAVRPLVTPGIHVLRLRSDKAGPDLASALRELGAAVDDCILYRNDPIHYDDKPRFDTVFFASASAVEVFDSLWGMDAVKGKTVLAIGKPTEAALQERGVRPDLVPPAATVDSSITALAAHVASRALADLEGT